MITFRATATKLTPALLCFPSPEVVKKGSNYMNIAMYVIRELYDAIHDCRTKCQIGSCNSDDAVHALDEAVAFYYGTEDVLMHALANKRCANFGTCSNGVDGDADVNVNVFELFGKMQGYLEKADCDAAEPLVEDIAQQMWVPLVQGTLRYAWIQDSTNNEAAAPDEKAAAEGAIFAAAILPVVHDCNEDAAKTIYDNMSLKASSSVDYPAVKSAFEQCYGKMGISCDAVGGLVDSSGDALDSQTKACSAASAVAVGSFIGASILGVVALLV